VVGKQRSTSVEVVPAAELSWDQVLAWRLRRQFLETRAARDQALAVTAAIGGLQAQVMSSAELGLWARVENLDREMVKTALWEDRSLVKVWAMRGTLHLLPSAEYPVWQAAASFRRNYYSGAYLRYFQITREELDLLLDAIGEVLRGKVLTREELGAAVAEKTGDPSLGEHVQGSWGSLLKPPAYRGDLCFGPSLGQKVRFTRPDEWLPNWQPADPVEAQNVVTRRYLAAYGPATRDELKLWWGVYAGDANKMLAGLDGEVATVEIEGIPAFALAQDLPEIEASSLRRSVKLLPAFDQYVLAAPRDQARVIPKGVNKRIYRNQGWISPVLLINGQMAGVWRHERKGARLVVQIELFFKIPAWAKKGAEMEAQRLADFLGGQLELTWLTP
jgi:hypothetical protein